MKYSSAISASLITFSSIILLNSICEFSSDRFGAHQPTGIILCDAFCPIQIGYIIFPIIAGIIAWNKNPTGQPKIVPTFFLSLSLLAMSCFPPSLFVVMNGPREITMWRYMGNAFLLCIGIYLAIQSRKKVPNKAEENDAA